MHKLVLSKKEVLNFIGKMLSEYKFFGPVDNGGVTLFKQVSTPSELNLESSNSIVPPKTLFFKQTETLFEYTPGRAVKIDSVNIPDEKTVVFGIRPCDAKSLAILDQVFDGEFEDPYYFVKRKNAVLVGLSCTRPGVNCFCTSFNEGPASVENVDILLTDIGDKYYVEVLSDKGEQLTASVKELLTSTKERDEEIKKEVEEGAVASIARHTNIDGLAHRLEKIFENTFWKMIASKCLGCGVCTYLCPTCHCFDIQDETALSNGARVRIWDSCMYPEYTQQASGFNPRPERMNRVRNRVYHKYNYYPKNYDVSACVGCGRCIDNCPVNIDIIDVIAETWDVKHD